MLAMGAMGVVITLFIYNYDIWYGGEDEINMGETQQMYLMISIIVTILLFVMGGALVAKGKKKRKAAMAAAGRPEADEGRAKKAAVVGGAVAAGAGAVAVAEAREDEEEPEPEYEEPEYGAPTDEPLLVYECPECGSPVAEDADMCESCGVSFAPADEEVVDEISISVGKEYPPPEITEEEMPPAYDDGPDGVADLHARDEKEEEQIDLDFGDEIDEDLDDDDEYVYECPECGGEVAEDATVCPHCAAEFED